MADITMCKGTRCTRTSSCYRFTAPVNEYRQSYFNNSPVKKDGTCDYYWDRK